MPYEQNRPILICRLRTSLKALWPELRFVL
jgi:hypothetical protein